MTTPQVDLDGVNRVTQAPLSIDALPYPPGVGMEATAPHALTDAERQGLAMSGVGITLGMLLLLGGLALVAAVALHAGFGGWLLGMALVAVVMVAVILAVNYAVLRPRR